MDRPAPSPGTNGGSAPPIRPLPGAIVVPITLIERDPEQPRWDWTSDDARAHLDELVRNIRKKGVLEPLLVRSHPTKPGHFIVIAGGRRLVAAKRAGKEELPVIVRDGDSDADRLILQLSENGQRQRMAPMDEARVPPAHAAAPYTQRLAACRGARRLRPAHSRSPARAGRPGAGRGRRS